MESSIIKYNDSLKIIYWWSFFIKPWKQVERDLELLSLAALYYPIPFGQVRLAEHSHVVRPFAVKDHHFVPDFWNNCLEIGLVDFDEGSADGDLGHKGLDYSADFALFIVEGWIDIMRLDFNSNPWLNPFNLFLIVLFIFVLLFQLLIKFFDVIQLLLIERDFILGLSLELVNSVIGRSFVVWVEAIDAEF